MSRRHRRLSRMALAPPFQQVDQRPAARTTRPAARRRWRSPRVGELLQPGDDQHRRDLRLERHVARDEDDRAVLARGRGRRPGRSRSAAAGTSAGRITRRNVCQRLAPSDGGRLLRLGVEASSTGCTVRTTNGKPVNTSTSTIAEPRVRRLDPERHQEPAQPAVRHVQVEYTSPATAVGRANGRSTRASNSRLSGNS